MDQIPPLLFAVTNPDFMFRVAEKRMIPVSVNANGPTAARVAVPPVTGTESPTLTTGFKVPEISDQMPLTLAVVVPTLAVAMNATWPWLLSTGSPIPVNTPFAVPEARTVVPLVCATKRGLLLPACSQIPELIPEETDL